MIRSLSEAGLNGGVGYERSLSGSFADEHSTAAMGVSSPSSASPTHPNSSHSSSSSPLATMMCKLPFGRLMAGVVFVALSLLTFKHWNTGGLEAFVLVIQNDPYGTMHLFFLAHVVGVVVMFPVMLLQVLSGALYGFYTGLAVTWLASSAGQALAFLLGRYLFRRSVKAYLLQRVPNFPQLEAAVRREGWKLMCLLRLSPVLPYNVLNYAAALTPISFLSYTAASSTAILPWTCLYTYLGTFSTSVVDLLRGKVNYRGDKSTSGIQLLSSVLYMALMGVTIVYGYHLSRRAMLALLSGGVAAAAAAAGQDGPGLGSGSGWEARTEGREGAGGAGRDLEHQMVE